MRRRMWVPLAALAIGVLMAALFRSCVTNQIVDGGNTENPFLEKEAVQPLLTEDDDFVYLSWTQNAMSYDDCYSFSLSGGPNAPVMACSFTKEKTNARKRIEFGEEDQETEAEYPGVPIPPETWNRVEQMLREMSLPLWQPPEQNLCDATANCLTIGRMKNGQAVRTDFDGTQAVPLMNLLMEIAEQAAAHSEEAATAESSMK